VKKKTEYDAFTELVDKILSVPHSEIKAKLDEEKKTKKRRRKGRRKTA